MSQHQDEVIRSADNSTAKLIRSLRRRQVRELERAFVVEGVRAVEDALRAGGTPRVIAVSEGATWGTEATASLVRVVDAHIFDRLGETESPQSVIAVFEVPTVRRRSGEQFVLVADAISDPGNLGTLIRSAAGAGATAVVLTPGTVDPYNGKAVRAAMGAHFRIPILRIDEHSEGAFTRRVPTRVLAEAGAGAEYAAFDWGGSLAIIVGSEAHGPSALGRRLATHVVEIPLSNDIESLNAAVAGSVLLFEAARQRRRSGFGANIGKIEVSVREE
jgi:TrmH family RNA methyltransferase